MGFTQNRFDFFNPTGKIIAFLTLKIEEKLGLESIFEQMFYLFEEDFLLELKE